MVLNALQPEQVPPFYRTILKNDIRGLEEPVSLNSSSILKGISVGFANKQSELVQINLKQHSQHVQAH